MDAQTQGVITLLRSGLTGEKLSLPEGFELEQAYSQLRRHQVQAICYLGALACGENKSSTVMQQLFRDYCMALRYSEQQAAQLDSLLSAFDEAGVEYMPLKGCRLKKLYPKPELRTMGDADILIRMEQYDVIVPIMQRLGFARGKESDHELVWQKGPLLVELHKRLFPSHNKDYHGHFGDGWLTAQKDRGTRYKMSDEDEFVYLLSHFAKHYRDGGIGCRHVADLWLYLRAKESLDLVYLKKQLKKLRLLDFYHNIRQLLAMWFEDGQEDDKTRLITHAVFQSGAWGERSSHILADALRKQSGGSGLLTAKLKRLWGLSFLPLWQMKQKYPVLDRWPVLLPVFWVVRIIKILFFTKGKIAQHSKEFSYMNQQRVSEYEQALHYVGLDFNFEE